MGFDTYHYADDDDYDYYCAKNKNYPGYQPNQSMTDEQKQNPPKGESGVVKLTNSLVEEKLINRIEELERRIAYLEKATGYSIKDTYFMRG